MNIVISYATNKFKQSQEILHEHAIRRGADTVINYSPSDLDSDFVKRNINILKQPRGGGLWLWKPYIILKALLNCNEGDKLLYCDSGMYPIENLGYLFDLTSKEKPIILFQVHDRKIKDWTNDRCIEALKLDRTLLNLEQVCGAPQLYTKNEQSVNFVKQLLTHCENEEAINDFGFTNHRYDQSILSILAVKEKIEIFRDPSQWGNGYYKDNSRYPQIFNLHRGNL
jgi:hypothetical protein